MIHYHGKRFITLSEYLNDGGSLSVLSGWNYATGAPVADLFVTRYRDFYISLPCPVIDTVFIADIDHELTRVRKHWEPMLTRMTGLLDAFVEDGEKETVEGKNAPLGGVNFEDASASGGTVRKRSGGNSGNIDRLISFQRDIDVMVDKVLSALHAAILMPASFGYWGCGV